LRRKADELTQPYSKQRKKAKRNWRKKQKKEKNDEWWQKQFANFQKYSRKKT